MPNPKPKAILTGEPLPNDKKIRIVLKKNNGQPIRELPHDYGTWLSHRILLRTRQAEVLRLYAGGKQPEEIALQLQMRVNQVVNDINHAIDRMLKDYGTPSPEITFIRYAAFQLGVIHKLQEAGSRFLSDPKTTQYNALVTSLRNQSDIYDKVINKGTELGVITKKQAKEDTIRTTPKDLRATIRNELIILERLMEEVDDSTQIQGLRPDIDKVKDGRSKRKILKDPKTGKIISTTTSSTYKVINNGKDQTHKIRYVTKIRKVIRTAYGIAKIIPDWKYRHKKVYDGEGRYIKVSDRQQPHLDRLPEPTKEQKQIELRKKFYESKGIAYIETQDGKLIPFDPDNP